MARQMATGGGIIAVIDTGIDARHPALEGSVIPGYDFIHNSPGAATDVADLDQSTVAILDQSSSANLDQSTVAILDQAAGAALNQSTVAILDQSTVAILDSAGVPSSFGHGTMVAGLIHLVAPSAKIMPLRVFGLNGTASVSNIVKAIYYAVENGAKVINMSFSMAEPSDELTWALNWASSKRVVMVASVANGGNTNIVYPAASRKVLGVASTSNLDSRSLFSSYGSDVSLGAPGEALMTTFPFGRYALTWGTSFSTALVSGSASLISQINPDTTLSDAELAFANAIQLPGQDLGWGRLNVAWACAYAQSRKIP